MRSGRSRGQPRSPMTPRMQAAHNKVSVTAPSAAGKFNANHAGAGNGATNTNNKGSKSSSNGKVSSGAASSNKGNGGAGGVENGPGYAAVGGGTKLDGVTVAVTQVNRKYFLRGALSCDLLARGHSPKLLACRHVRTSLVHRRTLCMHPFIWSITSEYRTECCAFITYVLAGRRMHDIGSHFEGVIISVHLSAILHICELEIRNESNY